MPELLGYARASTTEQNADLQRDAQTGAGCWKVFTDHVTGAVAAPGPPRLEGSEMNVRVVRDPSRHSYVHLGTALARPAPPMPRRSSSCGIRARDGAARTVWIDGVGP